MADVTALRSRVERWGTSVQRSASKDMETELGRRVPVDTGELRRSLRVAQGLRSTTISYSAPQGEFTDKGTRPHVILPRRGRFLRFEVGGRVVYARRVNHPGTRAQRWWSDTMTSGGWTNSLQAAAHRTSF